MREIRATQVRRRRGNEARRRGGDSLAICEEAARDRRGVAPAGRQLAIVRRLADCRSFPAERNWMRIGWFGVAGDVPSESGQPRLSVCDVEGKVINRRIASFVAPEPRLPLLGVCVTWDSGGRGFGRRPPPGSVVLPIGGVDEPARGSPARVVASDPGSRAGRESGWIRSYGFCGVRCVAIGSGSTSRSGWNLGTAVFTGPPTSISATTRGTTHRCSGTSTASSGKRLRDPM